MNKNFLEKEILKKIKDSNIKQKSRLYFILKNLFFWFGSFLFITIGGIAFASILYQISDKYYIIEFIFTNNFSFFNNLFHLIPYFWLIILIIFLFLTLFSFKKTEFSYKYNLNIIFLLIFIASGLLGVFMFYLGLSQKTEKITQKYIPFFDRHQKTQLIKGKIFVQEMYNLGFTEKFLNKNPKTKKKIEKKFRETVLEKRYIYYAPEKCLKDFKCKENEIFFIDKYGCGCRTIHINIKK